MSQLLIGIHAVLGEIGIAAFLWAFVELLNSSEKHIKRAKIASLIGVIFFFLSWIVGGYYYVSFYGVQVKPVIKAGLEPWVHTVVMEAKEHIFLFLPFLAIADFFLIRTLTPKDEKKRRMVLLLTGLIIAIGALMALMGYMISSGFRSALEAMHIS